MNFGSATGIEPPVIGNRLASELNRLAPELNRLASKLNRLTPELNRLASRLNRLVSNRNRMSRRLQPPAPRADNLACYTDGGRR